MASADSGNMLLLLSAVDQSLDRSNSNKLGKNAFLLSGFVIKSYFCLQASRAIIVSSISWLWLIVYQ